MFKLDNLVSLFRCWCKPMRSTFLAILEILELSKAPGVDSPLLSCSELSRLRKALAPNSVLTLCKHMQMSTMCAKWNEEDPAESIAELSR